MENKQFFKAGVKQNNVSTVIWFIKFLDINARDPSHWEEVALFTLLFTEQSTFNHIFVHFNHYDTFYSDNKGCAQRFIEFTDENLNQKVQIEDEFIYIMN